MRTDMIDNRPMQEPANRTRGEGASEATTGRGSPAHRNNKDWGENYHEDDYNDNTWKCSQLKGKIEELTEGL